MLRRLIKRRDQYRYGEPEDGQQAAQVATFFECFRHHRISKHRKHRSRRESLGKRTDIRGGFVDNDKTN